MLCTFLLCCSLVDCWLNKLSISISKWDVFPLLVRPFFSAPAPPDPDFQSVDPAICELEAEEIDDVLAGKEDNWSKGEEPGALFWWIISSAFLFTPAFWGCGVELLIIAHSLVWSTEITKVEVEVLVVGCRTSINSWAENLSRRLWMQVCDAGNSD